MNWSPYQQAIFKAVADTRDSLIIEAVAGSGKTTTIVEAINHVPPDQSVCFLAFNKFIAATLRERVTAPNARCMTLHSAGWSAWRQHLGWDAQGCKVDARKTRGIVDTLMERGEVDEREVWKFGGTVGKLVGLAKGAGIVPRDGRLDIYAGLVYDSDDVWADLIDFYGLDEDECSVELARRVLTESIVQSREVVDFDDQLYMPVVAGAAFQKFDVVFLDEAQDVNGLQLEMVSRMRSGRIIAVGDRNQAIYGFRGALSNSMDHIQERFHCVSLPLSISYRCPKSVVAHAQTFVSHILPSEDASEGLVEYPEAAPFEGFLPTDAILCRVTRPLIDAAFALIRAKVPCKVMGRDIGQGLLAIVKKLKPFDLEDLDAKLVKYRAREIAKCKGDQSKIASVEDKLDTLQVFLDEAHTLEGVTSEIERMFTDSQDQRLVTLSSVHKAKGLEFDRVWILDADKYMPSKWATKDWQRQQEQNLRYVACTRAKKELRYISSDILGIRRSERAAQG